MNGFPGLFFLRFDLLLLFRFPDKAGQAPGG
jgi:hypothetical protein